MGVIYSGKHTRFGMAEGSTFGTAIADASAFIELDCEPFVINPDVKHRSPNRANGQLMPDKLDVWNDTKGSMPQANLKGICKKTELDIMLYLLFQNVAEAATTPYQKTYTFPAVGPDFVANEGEFITLISRAPVASVSQKVASMIANKLVLDISAKSGGDTGNLGYDISLIGKTHTTNSNPSGTWTKSLDGSNYRYNFHNFGVCTIDGNPLVLESAKITLSTNITAVGSDGAGGFQNFAISGQSVEAQLSIIWDTNARSALAKLEAGTELISILSWGTTGVDGFLSFTIHGVVMPGSQVEEGDSRTANLTIKGISDATAVPADQIITVELANAIDRAW